MSYVISKNVWLSILSSVLLVASFLNFNFWLFAWIGFLPLFLVIQGTTSRFQAFLVAYLTGIIFWAGIIYWLVHVTLLGTTILVLYLAIYFGIFGFFLKTYHLRLTTYDLLFIPSLWVLLEYIRSHLFTGFPWALLGYSQYLNLPIIQIADITGAWGVSFLVMMVNIAIYSVMRRAYSVLRQKQIISIRDYFLPIFLFLLSLSYGFYQLRHTPYTIHHTLKISVIQGNIPQELKWMPASREYILAKYIRLTEKAAGDNPDLIIWPEAALPVVLEEEPEFFAQVTDAAAEVKTSLLLGAVTSREDFYYNSALLVSSEGRTLTKYHKLHLVPFGEYIPLRKILSFLETVVPIGEISPGREYTIFKIPNPNTTKSKINPKSQIPNRFAVLICFEDLFLELARNFVNEGADFLLNITNDAWYKKTSAPYQHLQASVFRAVENRVNLVRAANTGVSGFIAPSGKIISLVHDSSGRNIFIDGYKTEGIAIIERQPTFYTRYGDIFILILLIFIVYSIFRLAR